MPHHDLIDRVDPDRLPVALLREWKADREGDGMEALAGLEGLTEDRLAGLLEGAFRTVAPQREVTIELTGAIFPYRAEAVSVPLDGWTSLMSLNPHLAGSRLAGFGLQLIHIEILREVDVFLKP